MSAGEVGRPVETSWNAVTAVRKRASVMPAEVPVVDHRGAVGDVGCSVEPHAAADEIRMPRAESPAEARENSDPDSHAEAETDPQHDTDRNWRHDKARIGDHQRSEHDPGIVVRNVNQRRIHRSDHDRARLHDHRLLRCRHQGVRLLCLESQRLDRVHNVFRLVVIRIAELRRPRRIPR